VAASGKAAAATETEEFARFVLFFVTVSVLKQLRGDNEKTLYLKGSVESWGARNAASDLLARHFARKIVSVSKSLSNPVFIHAVWG